MTVALVQSRWLPPGYRPPLRDRARTHPYAPTAAAWLTLQTARTRAGALLTRLPVPEGTEPAVDAVGPPVADEHLIVDMHETVAVPALPIADVVVSRSRSMRSAWSSSAVAGSGSAGCLVATVIHPGDRCVVSTRSGWAAEMAGWPAGSGGDWPFGWYASLVHSWLVSGRGLDALDGARVTVLDLTGPAFFRRDRRSHQVRVLDPSWPTAR